VEKFLVPNLSGMSGIKVKNLREKEEEIINKLFEKDLEIQKQVQYNKIQDSRYIIRYRELYILGIPKYLRKQSHKDTQKIIVRFRCGNEELRNRFWRKHEINTCRL